MRRRSALRLAGLAVAGTLPLAGCVGGGESRYEVVGDQDTAQLVVSAEPAADDPRFDPMIAWVETGGSVVWKNDGGRHSTTAFHERYGASSRIPDGAEPWDSGPLRRTGATFAHTFELPGVYDYFCRTHLDRGMVGTVVVGAPTAEDQPALREPTGLPAQAAEVMRAINERVKAVL